MLAFPGAASGKKKAGKVVLSLEVALDALEKTVGRLETCRPSSTTLAMLELRAVAQARVVVEARRRRAWWSRRGAGARGGRGAAQARVVVEARRIERAAAGKKRGQKS